MRNEFLHEIFSFVYTRTVWKEFRFWMFESWSEMIKSHHLSAGFVLKYTKAIFWRNFEKRHVLENIKMNSRSSICTNPYHCWMTFLETYRISIIRETCREKNIFGFFDFILFLNFLKIFYFCILFLLVFQILYFLFSKIFTAKLFER